MKLTDKTKPLMAQALLELMPPLVRRSLFDDADFCHKYGIKTDAKLVFGDSDVSIQRSKLFRAIREVLSTASDVKIKDTAGLEWSLCNKAKKGDLPKLVIAAGERRYCLPDFSVLSPHPKTRLSFLDKAASDVDLPESAREEWSKILSGRPLGDDEVEKFQNDLRHTSIRVTQSILAEMKIGESCVTSLVPNSRIFFERLVGTYDGSDSIKGFAQGVAREFLGHILCRRPYEGFLSGLLLSAHSALSDEISVENLRLEDIVNAFDFLIEYGDLISRLGAIEVGLRILPKRLEIKPQIISLIESIRDDDAENPSSSFRFLSALFVLVDGEISRTRLFSAEPPFYRRLASLTHASLIQRQLIASGITDATFCDWAFNSRAEQFYMQSFADMRLEPRWNPNLSTASQIKADFFGRIMIAARTYEKNIQGTEIYDLILGADSGSLQSLSEFPLPYLPGPLEGAEDNPNSMPVELATAIQKQLRSKKARPSSFFALVNSAMVFKVNTDHAKSAADFIKAANYRLANIEDKTQLLSIMIGLALVSASSRNHTLADELRILTRRYISDPQFSITDEEALNICLIASASRIEMNEWRTFLGEWITEISFGNFQGDSCKTLHSRLQCLCHAVPELWATCSKADAALRAYIKI